jgi:hypothetical protein
VLRGGLATDHPFFIEHILLFKSFSKKSLSTAIILALIYKDYSNNSFIIKSLPSPIRQRRAFFSSRKTSALKKNAKKF